MENITVMNLKALAGRVLWCRVSCLRVKNVKPAGRMLTWFDLKIKKSHIKMDGWVCWLRSYMLSQLVTHCDVSELAACPKCRTIRARAYMTAFMTACCDIEHYGRELYWVLWPRAVMSSELAECQKYRASRPRAYMSSQLVTCCDVECVGRVLKMSSQQAACLHDLI